MRSTDKPTVTLAEARARMGRTFGVDPNYWNWTPAEIRYLAAENRRGQAEVAEGLWSIQRASHAAPWRDELPELLEIAWRTAVILCVLLPAALLIGWL